MAGFSVTFSSVLLILFYLFPGWILCRTKKVRPDHMSRVSVILLYVCGPCMFLDSLTALERSRFLTVQMFLFFLISLAVQFLLMELLSLLFRKKRKEFRYRMLALASVLGNTGYFGLPVVRALFPGNPEAAAYSCIFCATMNILAWTVGVFTLTGERKYMSLRAALLNPSVIFVALGFVLYLLRARARMPVILTGGIATVASMSTPLSMFILGVRLGAMRPRDLVSDPVVWGIAAGKLLLFPLFGYLLVAFLPLPEVFRGSILILSAAPCASILLNLAEIHENGRELAAACALLTTLLSVVTIPLLSFLL